MGTSALLGYGRRTNKRASFLRPVVAVGPGFTPWGLAFLACGVCLSCRNAGGVMPDYARSNPRHRLMVEYTAYGKPPAEIAEATGYAEAYVKAIQRSPLFQTEVANAQDEIKRNTLAKFAERLADEAMPSLMTLTSVRDNSNARDADRITAADKLIGRTLDLYVPKGRKDDDGKRVTKLVIEGGDFGALVQAIREVDGKPLLEIEAPTDAETTALEAADIVRPRTIEEMIEADETLERW